MPHIRFIMLLIAVIAISVITGGCASEQANARQALPPAMPATVEDWNNGTLSRVEFMKKFQLSDYKSVQFMPVDTHLTGLPAKDDNTYESVVEVLAKTSDIFHQDLQDKLKDLIPVLTPGTDQKPGGPALQLRIKVVEMSPGSIAARQWAGFGAGDTETLISGDLVDSRTNQPLLHFEDGHRNKGGLFDQSYDSLLTEDVHELADHVGILIEAFSPN